LGFWILDLQLIHLTAKAGNSFHILPAAKAAGNDEAVTTR